MEINFECKKCRNIFDCDVGTITVNENSDRPQFEQSIFCPRCGELTIDEVLLTELGQSQLTEATFDFPVDGSLSIEDDDLSDFGFYEGECQGCDTFQSLNDLGLCEECAGKLERDLIRQREWNYSVTAFGVDPSDYEELRKQVIAQHGENLELISPFKGKKSSARKRKKRKAKKRSS